MDWCNVSCAVPWSQTGLCKVFLLYCTKEVSLQVCPVSANLSPTAQLEGWLPPPTPASGRSLLQVPAARVKINQHPPASCEQEKISPEEGALGHLPSDEERRPLYQAVIIAWAFNPDILEITLWVGGAQRQKKREATATLNETIAQGFFLWRFPTHQRRNFVWCRAAEELWLSIFAQSTDKWHRGWDSSPGAKVITHVQQQVLSDAVLQVSSHHMTLTAQQLYQACKYISCFLLWVLWSRLHGSRGLLQFCVKQDYTKPESVFLRWELNPNLSPYASLHNSPHNTLKVHSDFLDDNKQSQKARGNCLAEV